MNSNIDRCVIIKRKNFHVKMNISCEYSVSAQHGVLSQRFSLVHNDSL